MTYLKYISLVLYNRLDYARQTLEHLSHCYGINNYTIFAQIDYSKTQGEMLALLNEYRLKTGYMNIIPFPLEQPVGCNKAVFLAFERLFKYQTCNYVIHIEDDICLSRDALCYFEWADQKYERDLDVFTVSAYNRWKPPNPLKQEESPYSAFRATTFVPWAMAIWKDRWNEIKDLWQFDYNVPRIDSNGKSLLNAGWDVVMKKVLRKDRSTVFPVVSRALNVGEKGVHTPSPEWHRNKHIIDFWANDFKEVDYTFPFKEIT